MQALLEVGLTNALFAALLGLLVFATTRFWRNPHVVHLLWVLVLVKLVTPPLVCFPWAIELPASDLSTGDLDVYSMVADDLVQNDSGATQQDISLSETPALVSEPGVAAQVPGPLLVSNSPVHQPSVERRSVSLWPILRPTAIWLWLTGSVVSLWVVALRLIRFHRCLQNTLPASRRLEDRTRSLASKIGLRRCPQVRIVQAAVAPLVWAVGKQPMIVLPMALLRRLDEDEVDTVVMHELTHIRRRDHLIRWFELVVTVLYWWNPVVWWARRELRQAEEQCCDAWVREEFPKKTKSYASALLETAEFVSRDKTVVPVMCNTFGTGGTLKRRVEMILNQTSRARLSWPSRLSILLVAALALPLSAQTATEQSDAAATVGEKSEDTVEGKTGQDFGVAAPAVDDAASAGSDFTSQIPSTDDLQARVKTLEKKIESLLSEIKKLRGARRGREAAVHENPSQVSGAPDALPSLRGFVTDPFSDQSLPTSKPSAVVSSKVVLALVRALKDEDDQVQMAAMKSLGNVGARSKEVILGLINALKRGSSPQVRATAAEILGFVGQNSDDAVTALIEAMEDDSSDVRRAAIVSLGRVASPSRRRGFDPGRRR